MLESFGLPRARPWAWRNRRHPRPGGGQAAGTTGDGRRQAAQEPLSGRRLGLHLPRLPRAAAADPVRRHAGQRRLGFANMLAASILDEPDADHVAVIFDAGGTTFRNEIYAEYKANRPDAAGGPDPAIPADPRGRQRLQRPLRRAGGLRGRRPDRDLRPPGARGRRRRSPSSPPTRT